MIRTRKRALAGCLALAVSASVLGILGGAPAAHAAGTLQGTAGMTPGSGISSTNFTLSLPSGASCGGDSSNAGYRVGSYMVPQSVDPSTLQFSTISGPLPTGIGASFRQPLYTPIGDSFVAEQTADASTPGGPGPIVSTLQFQFAQGGFAPGDIPAGVYNIGIACYLGPPSATQMKEFWNTTVTVTTNAAGGPAQISWTFGSIPAAPVLTAVTPGVSQLTAAFTSTPSTPATTGFTASATPTGGGATITANGAASPIVIPGLINGTAYNVTVHATNGPGNSPESNQLTGTPAAPPVANLAAVPGAPGSGIVQVSWDPPPAGPAPTGYNVVVSPAAGTTVTSTGPESADVSGLVEGTLYTFTVTPTYAGGHVGTPASVQASPSASAVLMQEITVTRPDGVLVLTQVCGTNGPLGASPASLGFPALPAVDEDLVGTAPTLGANGTGGADPEFPEYPLPDDPTYPTHCGIALGTAKLVTSGPGAGQFFAANGVLNQVTVVDTRDTDPGWTVNGTMGTFSAGPGLTFSGSQLGWEPAAQDTAAFTDSNGVGYDQVAAGGPIVAPNSANASGLSTGRVLGSAAATDGLGIAKLDARIKLLIPVFAFSGNYTGTLTLSAI